MLMWRVLQEGLAIIVLKAFVLFQLRKQPFGKECCIKKWYEKGQNETAHESQGTDFKSEEVTQYKEKPSLEQSV